MTVTGPVCDWSVLLDSGGVYSKYWPALWNENPLVFAISPAREIFDYLHSAAELCSMNKITDKPFTLKRYTDGADHSSNVQKLMEKLQCDVETADRAAYCQRSRLTAMEFSKENSWQALLANTTRQCLVQKNIERAKPVVKGRRALPNFVTNYTVIPYHKADVFFDTPLYWAIKSDEFKEWNFLKMLRFDALVISGDKAYAFELDDGSHFAISDTFDGTTGSKSWNARAAKEASKVLGYTVTAENVQQARAVYRIMRDQVKNVVCYKYGIKLRRILEYTPAHIHEFADIPDIVQEHMADL